MPAVNKGKPMGLLRNLLLLPAAPVRFPAWVVEQVAQEAERQEYSPAAGLRKIEEAEAQHERGEIGEDEAAELEGKIIEQQASRRR